MLKRIFTKIALLPLFLLFFQHINAQEKLTKIEGIIKSASNSEILPGVQVSVRGKKRNAISDEKGNFIIIAAIKDTLEFTYLGFSPQQIIFDGKKTVLEVSLDEKKNALDEVIVIGYGSSTKRDLTGSVTSLKANDLVDATALSFADALRGKAAGALVMSTSGEPGAGVNIKIRGSNSISASSNPLYVIDGVPIEVDEREVYAGGAPLSSTSINPLASIDPSNIESIEILKDASAAAIYGSRGANGVILITTKTAKKNEPAISFSSSLSISEFNRKLNVLGPDDYANYIQRTFPLNPLYTDQLTGLPISYADSVGVNWQERLSQNPLNQNYNIGLSKSNDDTNYYLSLGYNSAGGLVKESAFKRYSMLYNLNSKLSNKLKLELRLNSGYTIMDGQLNGTGQGTSAGLINRMLTTRPVNVNTIDDADGGFSNPEAFIYNTEKIYSTLRTSINTALNYNISKYLTLKLSAGGYLVNSKNKTSVTRNVVNASNLNGQAVIGNVNTVNWLNENTLNYNRKFNQNKLDVLLGYTIQQKTDESNYIEATNFPIGTNAADGIQGALSISDYNSLKSRWTLLSYLGRVNYSIKGKYIFTGSLRSDGSSKFQGNNKFSIFPAVAFSWQAGEEKIIKDLNVFDQLKVRASYGSIGNQGIPPYSSLGIANFSNYYAGNILTKGVTASSVSNKNLKWETTSTSNIGVDVGILKNRVSFTADIYKKDTKDLLLYAPLPSSSGFDRIFQNVGSLQNKGIELTLSTLLVKSKKFSWNLDVNYSANINTVKDLGSQSEIPLGSLVGSTANPNILKEGYSSTSLYGYVADGLYQTSDFESNGTLKSGVAAYGTPTPGFLKFKDISGPNGIPDGLINEYDLTIIGDATPKGFGGLRNTFKYKNLSLSVFVSYQYGNEILNWNTFHLGGRLNNNLITELFQNSWTPENTNTSIPSLNSLTNKTVSSSYYVQDASFIRLQNVQLSYLVPSKLCAKIGLKNIGINLSADNLAILTNYKYSYDPEVTSTNPSTYGVDFFSYPRQRSYTLGLNVKF
jgi:TonB-linked SusC/RagA family outer membrane protein